VELTLSLLNFSGVFSDIRHVDNYLVFVAIVKPKTGEEQN
jgi:hypothetical protein